MSHRRYHQHQQTTLSSATSKKHQQTIITKNYRTSSSSSGLSAFNGFNNYKFSGYNNKNNYEYFFNYCDNLNNFVPIINSRVLGGGNRSRRHGSGGGVSNYGYGTSNGHFNNFEYHQPLFLVNLNVWQISNLPVSLLLNSNRTTSSSRLVPFLCFYVPSLLPSTSTMTSANMEYNVRYVYFCSKYIVLVLIYYSLCC